MNSESYAIVSPYDLRWRRGSKKGKPLEQSFQPKQFYMTDLRVLGLSPSVVSPQFFPPRSFHPVPFPPRSFP